MKNLLSPSFLALAILASVSFSVQFAHAESVNDDLICPAIYPCQDDGTVLPEFSAGECGIKFAMQCAEEKRQTLSSTINECEVRSDKQETQVAKLKKQIRALKRLQIKK